MSVLVCCQAMAYFEQLKESQDAWEVCTEALAKGIYRCGSAGRHRPLAPSHVLIHLSDLAVMTMSSSSASKFWSIKSNLGEAAALTSLLDCDSVALTRVGFRHASLSGAQQQLIRETLMKWLQCQVLWQTHSNPHACWFLIDFNTFDLRRKCSFI